VNGPVKESTNTFSPYSLKLALTRRRRIPVLKNWVRKMPSVIAVSYSERVSCLTHTVRAMISSRRIVLITTVRNVIPLVKMKNLN
jgi:hypothetical protein